jgi:hypothetical protein
MGDFWSLFTKHLAAVNVVTSVELDGEAEVLVARADLGPIR